MSAIGWVSTLIPGTQMQGRFLNVYFVVGAVLAILYLASFVLALRLIIRALHRFSDENYSNPDDFPEQYTISILWITILHLIMSWAMAINGAMWALSFGMIVLSILSVVILLGALNPHRTAEVEQLEAALNDEKEEDKSLESDILPPERKEEILRAIRRQVESEKAFLDSHLTLSKLSRDCGLNRTYISVVLNESLGGFFNYINRCRLTHADTYKESHPKADVDEIALASGFNNRQSFYNARKRLNG
jgi:AraC-like DNA-binding protein